VIVRDSANDGFHEAIGDTIALSVTPEYLVKIGLLDKAPDASRDIGLLMTRAARKNRVPAVRTAHRPMALEGVLGRGGAADYNKAWWTCGLKYQGVAPPSIRRRKNSSIPAPSTTYRTTRRHGYFLAAILQFQFHRALSQAPEHHAAPPLLDLRQQGSGKRLNTMLAMGQSRPWRMPRSDDRVAANGCHGDPRLLRAALEVAGRATRRQALVGKSQPLSTE